MYLLFEIDHGPELLRAIQYKQGEKRLYLGK